MRSSLLAAISFAIGLEKGMGRGELLALVAGASEVGVVPASELERSDRFR